MAFQNHQRAAADRRPLYLRREDSLAVYGAVRLLKWLVDRKITPHVLVWDKSARTDGTFSRHQEFVRTYRAVGGQFRKAALSASMFSRSLCVEIQYAWHAQAVPHVF